MAALGLGRVSRLSFSLNWPAFETLGHTHLSLTFLYFYYCCICSLRHIKTFPYGTYCLLSFASPPSPLSLPFRAIIFKPVSTWNAGSCTGVWMQMTPEELFVCVGGVRGGVNDFTSPPDDRHSPPYIPSVQIDNGEGNAFFLKGSLRK